MINTWSGLNWIFAIGYFLLLLMLFRQNQMDFWRLSIPIYTIDYITDWGIDKIFFRGEEAMSGVIAVFAFLAGIALWLFWDD